MYLIVVESQFELSTCAILLPDHPGDDTDTRVEPFPVTPKYLTFRGLE
jgi:hypothetical protein